MSAYRHSYTTPLRAYIALRGQLNRAMECAEQFDWEETLASVDEARLTLTKLEKLARIKAPKSKEAA